MAQKSPARRGRLPLFILPALLILLACRWLGLPLRAGKAPPASPTPSPSAVAWLAGAAAPGKSTPTPVRPPASAPAIVSTQPPPTSVPPPTLLPISCLPPGVKVTFARAMWASSGDTIVVQIDGATRTVHYLGVLAAPVRPSAGFFGPPAATQNAGLIAGQTLRLIQDGETDRDALGRLERYVVVNDSEVFLNYEVIRRGLAEFDPSSPAQACRSALELAQQSASLEGLGRWQPAQTFEAAMGSTEATGALEASPLSATPSLTPDFTAAALRTGTRFPTSPPHATSSPEGTFVPPLLSETPTPTLTHTPGPSPTITVTHGPGCDPSYPTVCIAPPPPYLNCDDIQFTSFVVLEPDPHYFDRDGNGIGCEPGEWDLPTPTPTR